MARSVVSIDDLTNEEIEAIFRLADRFLDEMGTPDKPFRVRGRGKLAREYILATLFYEPSTRTRLSFESAMLRLGGQVISAAEASSSSVVKGESIADQVRVVENYADVIVIRHSYEGAARVAADYTDVPVINAGDGSHEHPTQTLCDLYTLRLGRTEKDGTRSTDSLKGLNVVLRGDLYHGRTVHSLAFALARFGAHIIPLAAPGCEFPDHVRHRLARDYGCLPLSKSEIDEHLTVESHAFPADVLYVTPDEPHQQALWHDVDMWIRLSKKQQKAVLNIRSVDAFYATRLQRERHSPDENVTEYPIVDSQFLKERLYRDAQVMHPLPRVDELSYDVDEDPRGVYFKQASYGVPVRMALIASLLELCPGLVGERSPAEERYPLYGHPQGLVCGNPKCVTCQESERRYLTPKFRIVQPQPLIARCAYCDHEQQPLVVSRLSTRRYTTDTTELDRIDPKDLILFADEKGARAAGHEPKKDKHAAPVSAD